MLICNTITMEPTIFCHTTALHALRSSRTWRGCIPWPALFSGRQRDVLRAANGHRDRIDVPWLEGLGIIPKREGDAPGPMHLLVANRSVHAKRPGIRTHQCSIDLPEGSLLEVATDCYVCSPALTLVQLAATAERADILKIAYEFMGLYTLPAEQDGEASRAAQALTIPSLKQYLRRLPKTKGSGIVRDLLPHLAERSRSPLETATTLLLTTPGAHGGFGLKMPSLNYKVELDSEVAEAFGRQTIECDLYFEDARVDIECNSRYHNNEHQRQLDDERASALASMDILVLPVSISQLTDLNKLERIAKTIAARSGARYRPRAKKRLLRQATLQAALLEDFRGEEPGTAAEQAEESGDVDPESAC